MAEATEKNCHFCSDPIKEGQEIVRRVDVWKDDSPAIIPAFVATGEVAHRGCAAQWSLNEDQIERFKARLREDLANDRKPAVIGEDDLPPAEIPGQQALFDG